MARSALLVTEHEVKILREIQDFGEVRNVKSEVSLMHSLRRLESKGLLERIPVPTFKVSKIGQHAIALQTEVENFSKDKARLEKARKPSEKKAESKGESHPE